MSSRMSTRPRSISRFRETCASAEPCHGTWSCTMLTSHPRKYFTQRVASPPRHPSGRFATCTRHTLVRRSFGRRSRTVGGPVIPRSMPRTGSNGSYSVTNHELRNLLEQVDELLEKREQSGVDRRDYKFSVYSRRSAGDPAGSRRPGVASSIPR